MGNLDIERKWVNFAVEKLNREEWLALLALILYHPDVCDGLLAMRLCLSGCLCVLEIMAPRRSNAKSQPQ